MELQNSPRQTPRPLLVGPWSLLVVQGVILAAYMLAGWGFGHERAEHDDLLTWLAAACMLFGLAPASTTWCSRRSSPTGSTSATSCASRAWCCSSSARPARSAATGGIARRWRSAVASRTTLHDGVAQELAYIASVARQLEHDVGNRRSRRSGRCRAARARRVAASSSRPSPGPEIQPSRSAPPPATRPAATTSTCCSTCLPVRLSTRPSSRRSCGSCGKRSTMRAATRTRGRFGCSCW